MTALSPTLRFQPGLFSGASQAAIPWTGAPSRVKSTSSVSSIFGDAAAGGATGCAAVRGAGSIARVGAGAGSTGALGASIASAGDVLASSISRGATSGRPRSHASQTHTRMTAATNHFVVVLTIVTPT